MNQGKLNLVKQEMASMNINILRIGELKWTKMSEFNSDDHYIYYCGQEWLWRNGVALRVNKRVWDAVLGHSLKNKRMISVHFQGKPFNITVIQVYDLNNDAKEAEVERVYEDLQHLLEPTPFHHRVLECKSSKSRDTWSNRQVWSWSTMWRGAKANRVLLREHTGPANMLFQQHKRQLCTWTSPDDQYWNPIDYTHCRQRWRSSIESENTRPGANCGSDHQLLIAKFRFKLKKVEISTRPFRYDLNKIPYDYTVEVMNRFKGLGLLDRVPEGLWMEICNIVQEVVTKTIPKEKCKKAKWLSEETLQIAEKRREVKGKGEKKRCTHLNEEFQRISRRDKKAFLSDHYKEIEENNRMWKTRDLVKKLERSKEHFMQRWAQ